MFCFFYKSNIQNMINFNDYANDYKAQHKLKWPYIPDHPSRVLIMGGSGLGKSNALLNLTNKQSGIDKICIYAQDPYEAEYQYLIKKREKPSLNHYDDRKAFIKYSNNMQDVYKNIKEYNLGKKGKLLIVFDD